MQQLDQSKVSVEEQEEGPLKLAPIPQGRSNIQGQGFQNVTLVSNLFKVNVQNLEGIYTYSLKIYNEDNEEIAHDARRLRTEIVKKAATQIKDQLGVFLHRGWNIQTFNNKKNKVDIENIKFDGKTYKLDIKSNQNLQKNINDLEGYEGRGNALTQAINNLYKRGFQMLGYQEKGKLNKQFDPESFSRNKVISQYNGRTTDYRMNVGQGYYTSAQIWANKSLYFLVDTCSKIVRRDTAWNAIQKLQSKERIENELVGFSVMASYSNQKNYIVTGIDWKQTPKSKFDHQGKKMTYIDYYKQKYNITIKEHEQPLLKTNVKFNRDGKREIQEIFIIPELVQLTGLPDELRRDFRCMQELAKFTKKTPSEKMTLIQNMAKRLNDILKSQGISLDTQNSKIPGKQLPRPQITIGNQKTIDVSKKECFNLTSKIVAPVFLREKEWILMYPKNLQRDADDMLESLQSMGKKLGIQVDEPQFIEMGPKDRFDRWQKELEIEISEFPDIQMVVTMLPDRNNPLYDQLKRFLLQKQGILHQNICSQSLRNKKAIGSICANIILQINAKMGKSLWYVSKPQSLNPKTMLIGIDVYHHNKNNSYVGFVSSYDPRYSQYNSQIVKRKNRYQEFLENIHFLLKNAILNFYAHSKFLPENIIIFRDGVGESQIVRVIEQELSQCLKLFQEDQDLLKLNKNKQYDPEFMFMIVSKRINQKFFQQSQGELKNPRSGTLVNSTITSGNFDFYLANQMVTQGTCTPTYYQVVHNSTKMEYDDVPLLCHWQSFNYYNWRGPVRVPAPVQYAHKLAYLVGTTQMNTINDKIKNKAFQL